MKTALLMKCKAAQHSQVIYGLQVVRMAELETLLGAGKIVQRLELPALNSQHSQKVAITPASGGSDALFCFSKALHPSLPPSLSRSFPPLLPIIKTSNTFKTVS